MSLCVSQVTFLICKLNIDWSDETETRQHQEVPLALAVSISR